jgi:hypothetical protein
MKLLQYFAFSFSAVFILMSCEKNRDTAPGTSDLEHHYYSIFVPNNNTGVTVTRSQTALLKLPVQFYSIYSRDYDAVAKYAVTTSGITPPAARGVDYDIVDKNGTVIPSADTTYSIIFPRAEQAKDTIYVKLLNNTTPGVRKFEIQMLDNITTQFDVDIFSTAYRRPVQIN